MLSIDRQHLGPLMQFRSCQYAEAYLVHKNNTFHQSLENITRTRNVGVYLSEKGNKRQNIGKYVHRIKAQGKLFIGIKYHPLTITLLKRIILSKVQSCCFEFLYFHGVICLLQFTITMPTLKISKRTVVCVYLRHYREFINLPSFFKHIRQLHSLEI